jgi:hypothetical protein
MRPSTHRRQNTRTCGSVGLGRNRICAIERTDGLGRIIDEQIFSVAQLNEQACHDHKLHFHADMRNPSGGGNCAPYKQCVNEVVGASIAPVQSEQLAMIRSLMFREYQHMTMLNDATRRVTPIRAP